MEINRFISELIFRAKIFNQRCHYIFKTPQKIGYVFIFCATITVFQSGSVFAKKQSKPLPVIFDTDMGNDIDDALALDMLYKYMDQGKVKILAICTSNDDPYAPEFIDIMNTWYGYPDIPVGRVVDGFTFKHNRTKNYAEVLCSARKKDGSCTYTRTIKDMEEIPHAVELYRRILSGQEDHSVTVISVGFLTNLGRLLDSKGDQYSSLSGKELIAKKVKRLSVMAGSFSSKQHGEFNIINDILNATKVFEEWPGDIIGTPFEIGLQVKYPAESIMNDFTWADDHPLRDAYKAYRKMPYDRYTWDLIAVLYAVDPSQRFFTVSSRGKITVDEQGYTSFYRLGKEKHVYLTATPSQADKMKDYFIDIITRKPAVFANKKE